MSHIFYWPGKYYLYAIGNTSAVCLTRDIPPEENVDILLLGCGDPRHVLYTIYSEPEYFTRKLDFTCVDYEPGVLARNMLLFTMIADNVPDATTWNIFYHMYLDTDSQAVLVSQCKKLVEHSSSMQAWRASPYSAYLRVSTEYTLAEIRRHWSLYVSMPELPSKRQKAIRQAFEQVFKELGRDSTTISWSSARSAGPLLSRAVDTWSRQRDHHVWNYRKTGTTFFQPKDVSAAKFPNPTLAYSLVGEGCALHYGTDPVMGFHLAALFGNAKAPVAAAAVVEAARQQFSHWCATFRQAITDAATAPHVRFFLSDATTACCALRMCGTAGKLNSGVPVAQFRTQTIHLDKEEYVVGRAPTSFDVIDTSNLVDYVGLLNVLISSVPLLSRSPSSVLYTESLLFQGKDATKEFNALLHIDIGTMAVLIDLCPIDYLSGFATRSNTHELAMYHSTKKNRDSVPLQYHQVTTWKSPTSCDCVLALRGGRPRLPPVFEPRELGNLLFDVYHSLFQQEDSSTFWRENQGNMERAIGFANMLHYNRETFAFLLKLLRERLQISPIAWSQVMNRFQELEWDDQTMPMNTINRNDLYASLHRHDLYTVHWYSKPGRRIGRFADWDAVPPIVRIILSVPREKILAFEDIVEQTGVGTPVVQCDVRGVMSLNAFSAIHVAYGRAIPIGTKRNPRVRFEEDPKGRHGTHPLVASFVMSAFLLTDIESPDGLKVRLTVRSTTGTVVLHAKMGLELEIFSASLMDEAHVHVLPEPQLPSIVLEAPTESILSTDATMLAEIGRQGAVSVELDEQCELANVLTARIDLEEDVVVREFGAGAMPKISQASPCAMRLVVAGRTQDVVFPFPVIGSQNRLRLARKSRYIDVVVPTAGPFLKPDGMKLNPFPVIEGNGGALFSWNVHRLFLDRLPTLDLRAPELNVWLDPHVGSMLSARERKMRKKNKADALLFIKDTLHAIFVCASGIQGEGPKRVFALRDETTNNCDTLFFISDLRYDLHSHTVVCDGYVLPLTHDIMPTMSSFFGQLVRSGTIVDVRVYEGEIEAWKQLIPAFVERCRTWEHTANCEYLAQQEVPLTQKMELDPLCSCGRGKDVDGLLKVVEWRRFAPFVSRIALSPLFAVSYLETVGRDPSAHKCSVCRGRGKPKMMTCSKCQKVRYCSVVCQRKDWPRHKPKCKA